MKIMVRDLGSEGERAFAGWCDNAGFSCNSSKEKDKYGWDFIVEFPTESSSLTPIDSLPPPIECKVQVKSTQCDRKGEQIKVSSLYRLVKYSNPSFICFIEYGDDHYPVAGYLVHIDKFLIDKVLKRVRELEKAGKGEKLHKSKITVKYYDQDRLASLDGEGVRRKILEYIPSGMSCYISEKSEYLENAGAPTVKLNAVFDIKNLSDIVDVSLGLKDSVEIREVTAYHKRFGIDFEYPDMSTKEGAILSMPDIKPVRVCKLVVREDEYSPGIEFKADVFFSAFAASMGDSFKKARVVTDICEFLISTDGFSGELKFEIDSDYSLYELNKKVRVMEIITQSEHSILELYDGDCKVLSSNLGGEKINLDVHPNFFKMFKKLLRVCSYFDVDIKSVNASIYSVDSRLDQIELIDFIIDSRPSDIKLSTTGEVAELPEKVAIVALIDATLFGYTFVLLLSYKGEVVEDRVDVLEKDIYKKFAIPVDELRNFKYDHYVKSYEENLRSEGYEVQYLDFNYSKSTGINLD